MRFINFRLPYEKFPGEFLKENLNRKVVVVSIIGKLPLDCSEDEEFNIPGNAESPNKISEQDKTSSDVLSHECHLEGRYDKDESVLYLKFAGALNTKTIINSMKEINFERNEGFLESWSEMRNTFSRALLFMFSFSHIIMLSSPTHCFDINIIQLLKVLSFVRPKYQSAVTKLLSKCLDCNEDLAFHGRLCSPRLIFLFNSCPYDIIVEEDVEEKISRMKSLEHSLEDQIYVALRKSRLVKNVCNRACFSIAPNDEFVFVRPKEFEGKAHSTFEFEEYFGTLGVQDIDSKIDLNASGKVSSGASSRSSSPDGLDILLSCDLQENTFHSFNNFLMKHVRKAHTEGFFDNMGKYSNVKPYFEVPKLLKWLRAVNIVLNSSEAGLKEPNIFVSHLDKLLGIELKFSAMRCQKILPLAVAIYQENLPVHYNRIMHEKKVKRAVTVFTHHARGPAQQKFIDILADECEKIWKNGRQTCEALSLNRNPCTKPMHQNQLGHLGLPSGESDHWSGVQLVSSCSCGSKQGPRQDPFTLRAANYDFYQIIGQECGCIHLEKIKFPVFQPSSTDHKPGVNQPPSASEDLRCVHTETSHTLNIPKIWSAEHSANTAMSTSPVMSSGFLEDSSNVVLANLSNIPTATEKSQVGQPVTLAGEWLPGLPYADGPPGLLPQFPSWSLLCRGPSSLYSHNIGLHDQPGFIPGSSYLLPWDVPLKGDKEAPSSEGGHPAKGNTNPLTVHKGGNKKNRISKENLNVKIFIGVEYECVRGHRFMSSGPGIVLKASGGGLIKEDANRITEGNMPLYLTCPCGKVLAQLMRLHIVTPKAPVYVTLDPRVRPAPPPCPIFTTGFGKPIALSQSAYWILRLPYVYASERKSYNMPSCLKTLRFGELIGPVYGVTEIGRHF